METTEHLKDKLIASKALTCMPVDQTWQQTHCRQAAHK